MATENKSTLNEAVTEKSKKPSLGTRSSLYDVLPSLSIAEEQAGRRKTDEYLKLFQHLINQSNDAIFIVDPENGRYIDVNQKACINLGYTYEELLTMSVMDIQEFLPDIESWREHVAKVCKARSLVVEGVHRRKDGTVFPVEVSIKYVTHEKIDYITAFARDITEHKKDAEKAFRENQLASIGELAAGVAHEINNPINGIINYAQILENRSEPLSREWDICSRIIKEGDRIAYIVSSLLSFAREGSEEKEATNICDILCNTLDLINMPLRKDNISVNVTMPSNTGLVYARPEQIRQVFLNIISNARYALNKAYPVSHENKILDISYEEKNVSGNSLIQIVFHDRGSGIPQTMLKKVMNPFFTTKPGPDGTGLGLSISHSIITEHGGEMHIESEEGEFTKVIVELPVKTVEH